MENHMRSILKSVSFRLIATWSTVVIVLVFTGEIMAGLQVAAIEFFGKILLYYFHERLWDMFQFGKK